MSFAARSPSESWEAVSLSGSDAHRVWIWWKPANVPEGLLIRIPDETFQSQQPSGQLTLRAVLRSAGVNPADVAMWYQYGVPCDAAGGTSPLLDQILAPPMPGADPHFVVYFTPVHPSTVPVSPSMPAAAPAAENASQAQTLESIDADWNACVNLEAQLTACRKQLASQLNRLNSLNRDLSPDESLHADRQDKSDWIDARRWLREGATRLSRYIKQHDMGETSMAGRRLWFEQTFQQQIAPRRPVDDVAHLQREFESYRKTLQMLLNRMTSALAAASQEGERRAQQLLSRIAAKTRAARTKRRGS